MNGETILTRFRVLAAVGGLAALSGCAHQTMVVADPPGTEVFINGERVGVSPVAFEDEPGWNRSYELTLKKDGYETRTVTLKQSEWNTMSLVLAAVTAPCTCGLSALYFLPRSRLLEDRYGYALKRSAPLAAPPEPTPEAPPASDAPPQAPAPPSAAGETKVQPIRY